MNILGDALKQLMDALLCKEIEGLAKSDAVKRELLDESTFDPTGGSTCFLAQLFGGSDLSESDEKRTYRTSFGGLPNCNHVGSEHYSNSGRDGWDYMTPLEMWSAHNWKNGNQNDVMHVFTYIKNGGNSYLPKLEYPTYE